MEQDIRQQLINAASKLQFPCLKHPDELANIFLLDEGAAQRGLICGSCYGEMVQSEGVLGTVRPLKLVLAQVHQSCNSLLSDLPTAAFLDHHLHLVRCLARTHLPHSQHLLQAAITNYFQKYRDLVTGRHFQDFYLALAALTTLPKHQPHAPHLKKLVDFVLAFERLCSEAEDYSSMTLEERLAGRGILKQVRAEVGELYKELREKLAGGKKSESLCEEVLSLLNPKADFGKFYRFSPTLGHPSLKLVDPKRVKMPDLPENEHTLMVLVEPSIGQQKKSIKFKMEGIKGWVAVGVAIRKRAEENLFKFQSTAPHGTFQISYDGYSWSPDSSVNEQYTSWYYNEGDTVTLTVNPQQGQISFLRNTDTGSTINLGFKVEKKDKLYFCVSLNYNEDSVSIVE